MSEPEAAVLASVPAAGNRRGYPAPADLVFLHGPMDCGRSTLALQVDHNQSRQGRHGLLLTQGDRLGRAADQLPGGRPRRRTSVTRCCAVVTTCAGNSVRPPPGRGS